MQNRARRFYHAITILQKHLEQGYNLYKRHRARWAKGKTGIGLDEHRAIHTRGYRARQSLVGLNACCANSHIPLHIHISGMQEFAVCTQYN